jgi:hypothetical protein
MFRKSFDLTIPFTEDPLSGLWYPIIEASFSGLGDRWYTLPLLLDTSSTDIVLRPAYQPLFPLGVEETVNTVGDTAARKGTVTESRIEFLGLEGDCEIVFIDIPANALFAGLLGRNCFMPFGFGFWEQSRELYVSLNP